MELAGDRRRAAHTVAGPLHGLAHGLRMPAGDGGNFVEREALDTIEEKSFAVGAVDAAERGLYQGNHFIGIRSLFGSGHAAIGNGTFAVQLSSGLWELNPGLVEGSTCLRRA